MSIDFPDAGRGLIDGEDLDRADAVASDGAQQVEGIARAGVEALLETPPYGIAVGQQIVEIGLDGLAAMLVRGESQGQGEAERPGFGGAGPVGVVLELHGRARREAPLSDAQAVGPDRERPGSRGDYHSTRDRGLEGARSTFMLRPRALSSASS
jgi:hypothetical protein